MADFSDKYNTVLSPEEERKFLSWAEANNKLRDTYDYDFRGAWKDLNLSEKLGEGQHLPDTYKKPNHPTFSVESKYNNVEGNIGGKWSEDNGKTIFEPSTTNISNLGEDGLKNYFDKYEKGVELKLPTYKKDIY